MAPVTASANFASMPSFRSMKRSRKSPAAPVSMESEARPLSKLNLLRAHREAPAG